MEHYDAPHERLGRRFVEILRSWLTPGEWSQMQTLNAAEPEGDDFCCHSHDFCDANMAMIEAFAKIHDREPFYACDEADEQAVELDLTLINAAWSWAKGNGLSGERAA